MSDDLLELYRWAVQDPETHAMVLKVMYERTRPGRTATVLREDFAGTSAESVAWAALGVDRRAVAVDLDGVTLAWARRRAQRLLGARASQIAFVEGDALAIGPDSGVEPADIISVLNFSIFYLRDPAMLSAYLSHARSVLAPAGLLVLNLFGGPGAVEVGTTETRVERSPRLSTEPAIAPFDYLWEVRAFDPAPRTLDCRIHFRIEQAGVRRELRDAFSYAWRLWSVEELIEACRRAGFSNVQMWRHTYDAARGAAGLFLGAVDPSAVAGLHHWTAYIVAAR